MNKTVSSSDIPVIMGLDNFKTMFQLWNEKINEKREFVDNIYTQRGTFFEPIIIDLVNKEYNMNIIHNTDIFYTENNMFLAKPDGFCKINDIDTTVEIKTTRTKDEAKEKYICQLQWQLLCTNKNQGLLVIFRDIFEPLEFMYIDRDDEYIEKLKTKAIEFLNTLDATENPYNETSIIPYTETIEQNYNEYLESMAEEYINLCEQEAEIKAKKDRIKDYLNMKVKNKTITPKGYILNPISSQSNGYLSVDISFSNVLKMANIPFIEKKGYTSTYIRVNKPKKGV